MRDENIENKAEQFTEGEQRQKIANVVIALGSDFRKLVTEIEHNNKLKINFEQKNPYLSSVYGGKDSGNGYTDADEYAYPIHIEQSQQRIDEIKGEISSKIGNYEDIKGVTIDDIVEFAKGYSSIRQQYYKEFFESSSFENNTQQEMEYSINEWLAAKEVQDEQAQQETEMPVPKVTKSKFAQIYEKIEKSKFGNFIKNLISIFAEEKTEKQNQEQQK